jgi:hypothetical protein
MEAELESSKGRAPHAQAGACRGEQAAAHAKLAAQHHRHQNRSHLRLQCMRCIRTF